MASKRTINRLYWAAVKATAKHGKYDQRTARTHFALIDALQGATDRELEVTLWNVEYYYGTHKPKTDLVNPELWDAREIVDDIRKRTLAGTLPFVQ